jgi:hypothetical protein
MLPSAAPPVQFPVSSNQVVDDEGQQHLEVQEHAAAVQLLSRSLAVAHLRAELAKPRWGDCRHCDRVSSQGVLGVRGVMGVRMADVLATDLSIFGVCLWSFLCSSMAAYLVRWQSQACRYFAAGQHR